MTKRTVQVLLGDGLLLKVEEWRRHQVLIPSRADAIRALIERGLGVVDNTVHKAGDILRPSPQLPLSTDSSLKTDRLSVVSEGAVNSGNSGDNEPNPKRRAIEEAQERAHQKLFATGVATLCDISGIEENAAHDVVVKWLLATGQDAVFVLAQIEAAKEMDLAAEAVPLISVQVGKHRPIALQAPEKSD